MKTKLLYLLFAICTAYTISSCKKDEDKNTTPAADISGVWMQTAANFKEWQNGNLKETAIDYDADSSLLSYNTDKTFIHRRNDTVYRSGTYVVSGSSIITKFTYVLEGYAPFQTSDTVTYALSGNKLTLSSKGEFTLDNMNLKYEFVEYYTKKN